MNLLKLLHSKRPLKQFVSFFCFISLFIPGCSQVYWLINDNAKEAKLYLMENITILRNDSSFFPLADTLVETSQIFLIGEEHGISSSREIEFNILKTLNNKTGIQHLLLEASHSFAIQINRYLTTGKTEYIDTLFESLRGTYAWTTEYSTFWKNLYAYNLTLAPENRTSCIGIDVEHQSASAIKFLAKLNPNTPPFDEIKTTILTLQNARFEKISYNAGWNLAVEIHKNLLEFESLYKEFYGENYYDFSTVLKNILSAKAVHEARKKAGPKKYAQMRDSIMCDNLLGFYTLAPKAKMFGFFGYFHVFREKYMNFDSFASLLESNDSPYRNKVLSICLNYRNCEKITRPNYKIKKFDGPFPNRIFDFYEDEYNAFFSLDGPDSPFKTFRFYPLHDSGVCRLFQYMILITNSKASQLYGKINYGASELFMGSPNMLCLGSHNL